MNERMNGVSGGRWEIDGSLPPGRLSGARGAAGPRETREGCSKWVSGGRWEIDGSLPPGRLRKAPGPVGVLLWVYSCGCAPVGVLLWVWLWLVGWLAGWLVLRGCAPVGVDARAGARDSAIKKRRIIQTEDLNDSSFGGI